MRFVNNALKLNELDLSVVKEISIGSIGLKSTIDYKEVVDGCDRYGSFIYGSNGLRDSDFKLLKEKIQEFAARVFDAEASALKFKIDPIKKQGVVYAEGVQGKEITFKELMYTARHKNCETIAAVDSYRQPVCPPHFTGYFVEVEVDTWTGKISLKKIIAGADIGTVINPSLAEGQIHGGLAQGLSMVTLEDMNYDPATGDLINRGYLTDYKIPYSPDMPDLKDFEVFFVETFEPTGPFGAKGIGEGALNPVAGAIANAVLSYAQ